MNNVTQYGTIFSAFGCDLNYISEDAKLIIADSPPGAENLVAEVIKDINYFDDCANYIDGASALCLATFLDGERNPLSDKVKDNVLEGLGIKKKGKFIYQVLSLQKNNRSWHNSEIASDCEHFGEVCTHRGIRETEHKGRRSTRQPSDYHVKNSRGVIAREQLVTPALETLFKKIPEDNLTSGRTPISFDVDWRALKKMSIDEKLRLINDLVGV